MKSNNTNSASKLQNRIAQPVSQQNNHRLHVGDIISYLGKSCPVVRVTDSSAVVAIQQPPREFTTLFGVRVHIKSKPSLVRISPNSEVPILNR